MRLSYPGLHVSHRLLAIMAAIPTWERLPPLRHPAKHYLVEADNEFSLSTSALSSGRDSSRPDSSPPVSSCPYGVTPLPVSGEKIHCRARVWVLLLLKHVDAIYRP